MLDLCYCELVSSCGERDLLSSCSVKPLIEAASLAVEHGLYGTRASIIVAYWLSSFSSWTLEFRLSSCDTRAWFPHGMWDLSGSEIEPMSPTLTGRFFTTEPPGKPKIGVLIVN